jgi:hypothetical protein
LLQRMQLAPPQRFSNALEIEAERSLTNRVAHLNTFQ